MKLILPVAVLVMVMAVATLSIWLERRLLALWQDRFGPNRVGPFGLAQVIADMVKIFTKEDWVPPFADKGIFVLAPAVIVITSLLGFAIIPWTPRVQVADLNLGVLYFLAVSSLGAYSAILAGWSSNNKYALLGSLRASAQVLSYEVFLGLALMGVVILTGSFRLGDIVDAQREIWYIVPQALGFALFVIAGVVEAHRLPFDIPLAETELVAGYHTEYSGLKFGLFYVGEYLGMLLIGAMVVTLYLGGWLGPWLPPWLWFGLKVFLVLCFFILLRAALPRPRYDQLMEFGWKWMLPLALLNLVATGVLAIA